MKLGFIKNGLVVWVHYLIFPFISLKFLKLKTANRIERNKNEKIYKLQLNYNLKTVIEKEAVAWVPGTGCSHEYKNTIGIRIYNQTDKWFCVHGHWLQGVVQEQAACSWHYSYGEQMINYYQYSYWEHQAESWYYSCQD